VRCRRAPVHPNPLASLPAVDSLLARMSYIPVGDQNPLATADGQARVMNAVLEQLCLLRAEVGAMQGTLITAATQLGTDPQEAVGSRIELRDKLYQRIQKDIRTMITGAS
jgi:hypothetical protein